jgi:hypothetical protein
MANIGIRSTVVVAAQLNLTQVSRREFPLYSHPLNHRNPYPRLNAALDRFRLAKQDHRFTR